MFSYILRNYSNTLQFYNCEKIGSDFSLILKYIQQNYHTLNLSELAKAFNYSTPYMCSLIKENTGYNFTDLIKKLKLTEHLIIF